MPAKPKPEDGKFFQLIKDFHEGHATRAQVAKAIHVHSTSIGLKWLLQALQALDPDSRIIHSETRVVIDYLCATQPSLQKDKYTLVALLFDAADTYDAYNREFFSESPVCVMHVGGGSYAILDGHHRVRRYAEIAPDAREISATLIWSNSELLAARFRQEVEQVRQASGTSDVRKLPIL